MRRFVAIIIIGIIFIITEGAVCMSERISLPKPSTDSDISLEYTIEKRRSVRRFKGDDLTLKQIGQLLWAAQGITDKRRGFRTAPSAGALYPMELYVVKKDGLYHYLPQSHQIERLRDKDLRRELSEAALGQKCVLDAPVDIIICAVFERVTSKYGRRGIRYTHIEAGHIAQNIHLQAVSLGLGSVPIGAFLDEEVINILNLPEKEKPLYIIPVGYPE